MAILTLYTLAREDFRDYMVCPKIVSIRAYREKFAARELGDEVTPRAPMQSMIGKAGEAAFGAAFGSAGAAVSGAHGGEDTFREERRRIERAILQRLDGYQQWIDTAFQKVVQETIDGIIRVRDAVEEELGSLDILGRGESRNGIAPGVAVFDFIALKQSRKPLIIEIKNTAIHLGPAAKFQAAFYNSLSEQYGVVIRSDVLEANSLRLSPAQIRDTGMETLLVNPRDGSHELINDRTDVSPERVKAVWEAKQLGYLKKTAQSECGDDCRHHKLLAGVSEELEEGTLEPVLPIPLAYARGLVEVGMDFGSHYLLTVLTSDPYQAIFREFRHNLVVARERPKKLRMLLHTTAEKLGTDEDALARLFAGRRVDTRKVERSIQSELDSWTNLVGEKRKARALPWAFGEARRIYPTPVDSERFVRDCGSAWS